MANVFSFKVPERYRRKIGFVGIGAMGTLMVAKLAAGLKLVIYDADRERTKTFAAMPGVGRANLVDLGRSSGTVITMLPDGRIVQSAVRENDNLTASRRA